MEEMKEQKMKRAKLEKRIQTLEKEADTLSLESEKKLKYSPKEEHWFQNRQALIYYC